MLHKSSTRQTNCCVTLLFARPEYSESCINGVIYCLGFRLGGSSYGTRSVQRLVVESSIGEMLLPASDPWAFSSGIWIIVIISIWFFCRYWSLRLLQAWFVPRSRKTVSICPQPPRNGRHVSLPGEGVWQPCSNSLLNLRVMKKNTVLGHLRYTSGSINPSRRWTFSSRAWTTFQGRSPFWQGSLAYMRSARYCSSFLRIRQQRLCIPACSASFLRKWTTLRRLPSTTKKC